ncbi:MAG: type II secretion system protein [Ignavibacteriales bacterium]|nr:type II secretion system protein [Ignavibacteriales bacterium]
MFKKLHSHFREENGYSLTELLVVLVIIGILVLLALPRLMPIVTKAKATEAKLALKQLYLLEKSHKFEFDKYSDNLAEIGFEQEKLISEGGTARYKITITVNELKSFKGIATSVVDFDNDGVFNVWEVNETGIIKETTPD